MKTLFAILFFVCSINILAEETPQTAWGKQYGFALDNLVVAADKSGNCFIAGVTSDSLSSSFAGKKDAFVRKFDALGNVLWTINVGSTADDYCSAITTDLNGNCYVAGKTEGELASTNLGGSDAFIIKINPSGNIIWKKQFGTNKNDDLQSAVADNNGDLFVAGSTLGNLDGTNAGSLDAILLKLDTAGNVVWQKQYGTRGGETADHIAFDKNKSVYVILTTKMILQYDLNGNYVGKNQHTLYQAKGIVLDDSLNMYVGGYRGISNGSVALLIKYDKNFKKIWERTFGSGPWTGINSMIPFQDGTGDMLVGVCQNYPNCLGVCRRYDTNGNVKWEYILKDNEGKSTCGHLVAADGSGNCFLTGFTSGNLFGTLVNSQEVFLAKISVITSINDDRGGIPDKFELEQNYPNPFNPTTKISYSTPVDSQIKLTIFNIDGKIVRMLLNKYQNAGNYSVDWNGESEKGEPVSSGIYFYRLESKNINLCKKMILLR